MRVVVLPGRAYDVDQPLLATARRVLAEHGHQVVPVRWPGPPRLDDDWVAERLRAAVDDHDGPVLVVGKSLGTRAAAYVG